ncbi:unnamed protein product [Prorocentrum cordatum]|uniref:Secreted protein n=1 Tax=Prorocentrum cordatum TaxID=2364126 RepID=A0ABN9Y2N4_9DINO|nr:unnamed protein product [Polarella glacialis]
MPFHPLLSLLSRPAGALGRLECALASGLLASCPPSSSNSGAGWACEALPAGLPGWAAGWWRGGKPTACPCTMEVHECLSWRPAARRGGMQDILGGVPWCQQVPRRIGRLPLVVSR